MTRQTYANLYIPPSLQDPDKNRNWQLMNQTQIKIVFGNVPPILDVHSKMLAEFRALMRDWREADSSVGTVFLRSVKCCRKWTGRLQWVDTRSSLEVRTQLRTNG